MGLRNGCAAKVWRIKRQEDKYTDVELSVSNKNKNGEYEKTFSGFARFIGKAKDVIDGESLPTVVKIDSFDVSTSYNAEKKQNFTAYTVFECSTFSTEKTNKKNSAPSTANSKKPTYNEPNSTDDEEEPF